MKLDLYTLVMTSVLLNTILTAYLIIFRINYGKEIGGVIHFIIGMVCTVIGFLGISLQNSIPPFLSIVLSNVMFIIGSIYFNIAFHRLFNSPFTTGIKIVYGILIGITFVEQAVFTYYYPSPTVRVICISLLAGIIYSHIVFILFKFRQESSLPGLLLFISYVMILLTFIIRIPMTLAYPIMGSFIESSGIQSVSVLIWVLATGTWPIGFALLISYKLKLTEQQQNKEKTILLRELNHRTKNNMQVISSMLEIQRHLAVSQETKDSFLEIQNKIQTMALVHKKLQQSNDFSFINIKEFIEDLVQLIITNYALSPDKITVELSVAPFKIIMDIASSIGLIIHELISNSIKHAFPDQRGKIIINITEVNNIIKIQMRDNGRGLPEDFNITALKSLGLKTIINIVRTQLSGTINFNSDDGFMCDIEFKNNIYSARI